jgi:6-methylsalicylate decarboxylase
MLPKLVDRIIMFEPLLNAGTDNPAAKPSPGTTDALKRLWCDLAGAPIPTRASTLINTAATHHIGYGSGCCRTPSAVVARQIASLDNGWDAVSDAPWAELTTRNAHELLGRPLLRPSIECGYA